MRKTSNCKTLAYTTVCKENEDKKKLENIGWPLKFFNINYQRLPNCKKTDEGSNTDVACDDNFIA